MSKIIVKDNKVLILKNVICKDIDSENIENFHKSVVQIESYVRTKDTEVFGPLIQYTELVKKSDNSFKVYSKILWQIKSHIEKFEEPYKGLSSIRIPNCMYCRYVGPEEKLKFAYDKIMLTAFEEDIPLKGDSYTVFVDKQDDNIIADVFMERADNE